MRTVIALFGLTILFAIFAAIHYRDVATEGHESGTPAFTMAPGTVRSMAIPPSFPGTDILVNVSIRGSPIDIYVMDAEWAATLAADGLQLDRPFAYHAAWSRQNVSDKVSFAIPSDGRTHYNVVLDHSDNFYDGDAAGEDTVLVDITMRFLGEERRSLLIGYLATIPSIILVLTMIVRKWRRKTA